METKQFTLKHSIQPYVIIGGIIVLLAIGWLVLGFFGAGWSGFGLVFVIGIFYALKIRFYDFRYTISFKDNSVIMHVATWSDIPAALTTIKVVDITSIQRETSDLRTIAAQQRVTQRIAIYDQHHNKFIDVSLKHFVADDIRKLMQTIHKERPSLAIPEGWL
jgi:hypothetical protein